MDRKDGTNSPAAEPLAAVRWPAMNDRTLRWSGSAAAIGAAIGLIFGLMLDQLVVAVVVGLLVGGLTGAIGAYARRS